MCRKQPIKTLQTCENSDSHVVPERDFKKGDLSLLEALQILGDTFEHEISPGERMTGSFVTDQIFN